MKNTFRIISLLLVLLFSILTFASAETIDISALSFDELVALKQKINLAIMQSEEWKEVTVPAGTYVIGEDIPAGDYMVSYSGSFQAGVAVYPNINSVDGFSYISIHLLSTMFGDNSIGKLSVSDGQVVEITYGTVVFAPYTGLGF